MQKVYSFFIFIFLTFSLMAQSPEKISYQSVIRNNNNQLVVNQIIGMQISILQGSIYGSAVYVETQTPTTNENGLITTQIGSGTVVVGSFNTIDWSNGSYFIKTEIDISGGTNYNITGVSQLLSVPYALHAKSAETIVGGITETDPNWTNSPSHGITSSNISNWNTTFSWGNHASAGYLTSFTETDSLWTISPSHGITNSNISDWNSAFVWGNHSGLYRPITWVPLWNEIINKPTTIAGYGITDAFSGNYYDLTNKPNMVSETNNGFMTISDKIKLDSLENVNIIAGDGISITGTFPNLTINSVDSAQSPDKFYLGQDTLGGIVFYIYIGNDGTQHGLIVSKIECINSWDNSDITYLVGANRTDDGAYNTNQMSNSPAKDWATGQGIGWYLPSIDELALLWHNRFHVNKTARAIGTTQLFNNIYWSSTEYNIQYSYIFNFSVGTASGYGAYSEKDYTNLVRAVRAF